MLDNQKIQSSLKKIVAIYPSKKENKNIRFL